MLDFDQIETLEFDLFGKDSKVFFPGQVGFKYSMIDFQFLDVVC